jgi:hypothetical protein
MYLRQKAGAFVNLLIQRLGVLLMKVMVEITVHPMTKSKIEAGEVILLSYFFFSFRVICCNGCVQLVDAMRNWKCEEVPTITIISSSPLF